MKISGMKKYLAILHKDKLFIKRATPVVDSDGSTRLVIPVEYLYSNVPCRVSFTNQTDYPNTQTDTNNPIKQQIKIFCDPKVDVKKGDELYVERYDEEGEIIETYKGMTGNKPTVYNLNKEILFTEIGDA